MNAQQRRKWLRRRLSDQGSISVTEAARELKVSKMTIHRDLRLMEEEGVLRRIFGGAVPVTGTSTGQPLVTRDCVMCSRPGLSNLKYIITLRDGTRHVTCCPHCGLAAHLTFGPDISLALASDFLTSTPFSARAGVFVMQSAVSPCCSPSVLAFEHDQQARRFIKGFGGWRAGMEEALQFLQDEAGMGCGCCKECDSPAS